jgi:putative peptidoglycan lipid II flippase
LNLARAAATVGSLTLISRLLGFGRDMMIAAFLGAGAAADAFFVAFKLANLLRRLFAEGAFNAAFVPLFARTFEGEGAAAARKFAREAFAVLTLVLLGVVALAEIFMPVLVRILAAGFEPGDGRYELSVELSRITFPYLMLISLAALASGVLNSLGRFAAASLAPVLLNVVLIAALLLSAAAGWSAAHALAWGVAAAGVVQLAWVMWAAARAGMALTWVRPRRSERIGRLYRLMLPGIVGTGVYQLNLVVDTWFASHLPPGAVSWLFYADRLVQLPLGMVGIAIGTALLPALSRQLRAGQRTTADHTMNRGLELGLLLTLPAAVALAIIAGPIIHVLFERGSFDPTDTSATAAALAAFAVGLPAYVLIKVLAPAFFAREDTSTPVKIAALCLAANVGLILLLIQPLAHVGIALATGLSNWINAGLLATILYRRGDLRPDTRLKARLPRLLLAALLMGFAVAILEKALASMAASVALVILVTAGGAVFFIAAQVCGGTDLRELRALLARPSQA